MTSTPIDPSTALRVAERIGEHLCQHAYRYDGRYQWMGTVQDGDDDSDVLEFSYETLGPDLYGGTSGVALFLAELHARTGNESFREVAAGGIAQALAHRSSITTESSLSLHLGGIGLAYAAARVGRALGRPDLLEAAANVVDETRAGTEAPKRMDIIGGLAGVAPALLVLAGWLDRPDYVVLAKEFGLRIVAAATKTADSWSWGDDATGIESAHPLTGFAHGAAGIGWALFELHLATGDAIFLQGATEAFRYEAKWFQADADNWPDFRMFDGDAAQMPSFIAWCHGAPGIGLSRLRAFEKTGDTQYRRDIEAAVRSTIAVLGDSDLDPDADWCLCHGLAGLAEFLLLAAETLGDTELRRLPLEVAHRSSVRFGETPALWPTGVSRGSVPSLMMGLAGIGHWYLRLADPGVSSVLLIAPGK